MASKSRVAWVGLWGWICLSLFAGTGVSGQEFFVSSETATVGAQFQVTVSIQAPTPTAGFNFDLCHDTAVLRLVSAAVVPAISAQADLDQVSFFDGNTPCDPVANPGCSDNVSVAVVAAQNPLDASAQLDVFVVTYELLATIPGGSTAIMICDGGSIPVASINDAAVMPFTLINGGMAQGTVMEPVGACIAPVNLLCGMVTGGVELNWVNASVYDTITVSDQAGFVATVAGTATTFTDLNPGVGALSYTVTGNCSSPPGGSATSATCLVQMIELSADNVVAGGGQTIVEVPVRLTFGAGVVLGGQFGMLYDNARLQLIEVVAGADFPTMETIIFQEAMTGAPIMSGLTVTFIADDGAPGPGPNITPLAPPNNEILLLRFTILTPNDNSVIPLSFSSNLLQPNGFPLPVLLSVNLDVEVPMQTDGSVSFVTTEFIRGDANEDTFIGLGDVVRLLQIMFIPSAVANIPQCNDAFDVDNSESLTITDPIYLLTYLFGGGPSPQAPFAGLGSPVVPFPGCGGDTGPATAVGGGSLDCAQTLGSCIP